MKLITKPRTVAILFHVLIWSTLILLPFLVSTADHEYKIGSIPGAFFSITGLIHAAIFYCNAFYLYPVFLNKRFWWLYILLSGALIYSSFQLKFHLLLNWFPGVLHDSAAGKFIFGPSVAIFIFSVVYRKVIDQLRLEKALKESRATLLETELKFLRSQINPHFLFNVITNLVALARKKSDQLEPALIKLSELLRYTAYNAQSNHGTLQKEISYLNSYIELQKLRFGNDVEISSLLDAGASADGYLIEPMLLIPFVENAFKHGVNSNEKPWVKIRLVESQGILTFEVANNFEPASNSLPDESSGIGLGNVKSRLALLYKDKHQLVIENIAPVFRIVLTLKLQ